MGLLWALLSLVATIASTGLGLLLAWAVYYHLSMTEMPPGICQPFKVRLLHILVLTSYGLVSGSELGFFFPLFKAEQKERGSEEKGNGRAEAWTGAFRVSP